MRGILFASIVIIATAAASQETNTQPREAPLQEDWKSAPAIAVDYVWKTKKELKHVVYSGQRFDVKAPVVYWTKGYWLNDPKQRDTIAITIDGQLTGYQIPFRRNYYFCLTKIGPYIVQFAERVGSGEVRHLVSSAPWLQVGTPRFYPATAPRIVRNLPDAESIPDWVSAARVFAIHHAREAGERLWSVDSEEYKKTSPQILSKIDTCPRSNFSAFRPLRA